MKNISLSLLILLFLSSTPLKAQRNNVYWFGDSSLINFGLVGDKMIDTVYAGYPQLNNKGNVAVATHPITGKLLFYSDGNKIYNRLHNEMATFYPNDTIKSQGIQRTAIAVNPSIKEQYWLFVNNGDIKSYRINIDHAEGGGTDEYRNGKIDSTINVYNNIGSAMTVLRHQDNEWLLCQNRNTKELQLFQITENTFISVNRLPSNDLFESFKYNPENKLIVASPHEKTKDIQFISLDPTGNGNIVNPAFPKTLNTLNQGIFATEWLNDSILYVSYDNSLRYYNIKNPTDLQSGGNPIALPHSTLRHSYDIKKGPNGKIYHLYEDGSSKVNLARITHPGFLQDDPSTPIDESLQNTFEYEENIHNNNYNSKYFPTMLNLKTLDASFMDIKINHIFETTAATPGSVSIKNCQYNKLKAFANISYGGKEIMTDSYTWTVGTETYRNQIAINHELKESGSLILKLEITLNGQTFSEQKTVTVEASEELQINPQDTVICPGLFLPLIPQDNPSGTGGGSSLYLWSSGDTTKNLSVGFKDTDTISANFSSFNRNLSGEYKVWKFSGNCIQTATSNVTIYGEDELRTAGKLPPIPSPIGKWYFGDKAVIDFNNNNGALNNSLMIAKNGVETVFNDKGEVLFYTNGKSLWTNNDAIIKNNGTPTAHTLLANDLERNEFANHGVKVIQVPNEKNYYYVFTSQVNSLDQYKVSYSLINTRGIVLDTTTGQARFGITIEKKNQLLFDKGTERIGVTNTGNSKYLVLHEFGTNRLVSFSITEKGISEPIYTTGGPFFKIDNRTASWGEIEITENNKVAVPYVEYDTTNRSYNNSIILYNIDTSDNNFLPIEPTSLSFVGTETTGIYGLESVDENLIFSTRSDLVAAQSEIIETKIDNINHQIPTHSHAYRSIFNTPTKLGEISTAPDNRIYIAEDTKNTLGAINQAAGGNFAYTPNQLNLGAAHASSLSLPSYNLSPSNGSNTDDATLELEGYCLGDTTFAYATKRVKIDEISWDFGVSADPSLLTFQSINTEQDTTKLIYKDDRNGRYIITATFSRCTNNQILQSSSLSRLLSDTKKDTIDLNKAYDPILPTQFCKEQTIPIAILDRNKLRIENNNIPSTVKIEVINASSGLTLNAPINMDPETHKGIWVVKITSDNKCSSSATMNIHDQRPQFHLANKTFCVGDEDSKLEAQITSVIDPRLEVYEYTWKREKKAILINGKSKTKITEVNPKIYLTIPNTKKDSALYSLTIYENGEDCQNTDSATVVVNNTTDSQIQENSIFTYCFEPNIPLKAPLSPGQFSQYEWTNLSKTKTYNTPNLNVNSKDFLGEYNAKFTNQHGCHSYIKFEIIEECDTKIMIPTAFTPEGQTNTVFRIAFAHGVAEEDFEISIFNRWGELIYFSDKFSDFKSDTNDLSFTTKGWNGKDKSGNDMPAGSYAYVLKYKSKTAQQNKPIIKRGSVFLIR